jgi:hypothetical protein
VAQTVSSSTIAYVDPVTALQFVDLRPLCDLLSDTEIPLTKTQLIIQPGPWYTFLMQASGILERAILMGNRYQPSDLLALMSPPPLPPWTTGLAVTAGGIWLQSIVSQIAAGLVIDRRPDKSHQQTRAFESIVGDGGTLDQLANGTQIFGFAETQAAGIQQTQIETFQDIQFRNGAITQARRYWGYTAQDYPYGQGGFGSPFGE